MSSYSRPASVWLPPELDGKAKELHSRMAVYIDYYKYKPANERDDAKIYEYLYHISYMLACKARLFQNMDDYDSFALYSAAKVYERILNKKQFDDSPKLAKITSILNYIKHSLFGMKVSFQKEHFNQIFDSQLDFNGDNLTNSWKTSIQQSYNEGLTETVVESIKYVPAMVKKVVKSTPYSSDPIMSRRLYLSLLLSFLNTIKLPNKYKNRILRKEANNNDADDLRLKYIQEQADKSIILWRIDNKLYDYVDILLKRVKHKFVKEIFGDIKYYEVPDSILNQIIKQPLASYTNGNLED